MAICCRRGLVSKAQELLDDINIEVNDTTDDGRTFLYIAAEHSHLNLVQLLLKNDANPNLGEENTGVTPIMAANSSVGWFCWYSLSNKFFPRWTRCTNSTS